MPNNSTLYVAISSNELAMTAIIEIRMKKKEQNIEQIFFSITVESKYIISFCKKNYLFMLSVCFPHTDAITLLFRLFLLDVLLQTFSIIKVAF